mgnify:CR=1 FL=1
MSVTASQMDYVLPNELVDGMIGAGGKKSTVSIKNLLVRGFYSGAILGLAVILALTVGLKSGQPWLGSLLSRSVSPALCCLAWSWSQVTLPFYRWPPGPGKAPGEQRSETGHGYGSATGSELPLLQF